MMSLHPFKPQRLKIFTENLAIKQIKFKSQKVEKYLNYTSYTMEGKPAN